MHASKTRLLARLASAAAVAAAVALVGWLGWSWHESRLPGRYNVMDFGTVDHGGGRAHGGDDHGAGATSVAELTGPRAGEPNRAYTLTAARTRIRLPSGRTVDTLAFDGSVPGPELRVRQDELVEVTLENADIEDGVSIHWHGVDVPNAEDGVAGVTQDAVGPGKRHVYRFRADRAGTYWYHSHQASSRQVKLGLYGALVVLPAAPRAPAEDVDLTVVAHTLSGIHVFGSSDDLGARAVDPGSRVRLRLVNTDSVAKRFVLAGTRFRVLAIDGSDLNAPGLIARQALEVAAGGRYDVGFTMPPTPVTLGLERAPVTLTLSADGRARRTVTPPPAVFDPATYGRPARTPFTAASRFDRRFVLEIGRKLGFRDGKPGRHWSFNGRIHPDLPVFAVRAGDLVRLELVNRAGTHPMHLHGHHALVLSRNGVPVRGSPWWVDTLHLRRGDRYELAFRADNPGVWMLHCHNLGHAADGMATHLVYEGVTTPFEVGGPAHNHPE